MSTDSLLPSISVVLCTYKPNLDFLKRVLDGVRRQTLPHDQWEFIIVDNNSPEPLIGVGLQEGKGRRSKEAIDLSDFPRARIVVEKQQGLSHARRRGFQEAKGEIIVNLDDDVVLDDDYLEKVRMLTESHPFIGAFGCQRRAWFEAPPERPVAEYYSAERKVDEDVWSNIREHFPSTPAGAGSVVRKCVAEAYIVKMTKDARWGILGRTAGKWLSCEDIEIAMIACDLGLGKGVFRLLNLTHMILASKMTEDFQCKNACGNGYSSVVHNYLRFGRIPPRPSIFAKLNRLYRLWRMSPRKRREELAKDKGIRDGRLFVIEWQKGGQNQGSLGVL